MRRTAAHEMSSTVNATRFAQDVGPGTPMGVVRAATTSTRSRWARA